jgi:hypothetical protein
VWNRIEIFGISRSVRIQVEARGIKEGVCFAELTIPFIGWSKTQLETVLEGDKFV